jgi:DNA-binding XRE family transcriptional regulator
MQRSPCGHAIRGKTAPTMRGSRPSDSSRRAALCLSNQAMTCLLVSLVPIVRDTFHKGVGPGFSTKGGHVKESYIAAAITNGIVPVAVLPAPEQRRQIREAAGISRRALARVLGVHHHSLMAWESSAWEPRQKHDVPYRRALAAMQAAPVEGV